MGRSGLRVNVAAVVLLVLLAASPVVPASAATEPQRRQKLLLQYARRVNGAISAIIDGEDEAVGAHNPSPPPATPDTAHDLTATTTTALQSAGEGVGFSTLKMSRFMEAILGSAPEEVETQELLEVVKRTGAREVPNPVLAAQPLEAHLTSSSQPVVTTQARVPVSLICSGGRVAFTADSTFDCQLSQQTDLSEFLALSHADKRRCNLLNGTEMCLCPYDAVPMRFRGMPMCETRYLLLHPELDPSFLCRDTVSESLELNATDPSEYCITTPRHGLLTLQVTWRFRWLTDDEMKLATNSPYKPLLQYGLPSSTMLVLVDKLLESGTIDQLRGTGGVFDYLVPPTMGAGGNLSFCLSRHNALVYATVAATTKLYSFVHPELMDSFSKVIPLTHANYRPYLGSTDGTTHTIMYDLGTVPDDFVEGGQMYLETGMMGGYVLGQYRVARIHITFSDVPVPPETYTYRRPFSVLLIVLIAFGGCAVLGLVLAVLWHHCQKPAEPDEDTVVKVRRSLKAS